MVPGVEAPSAAEGACSPPGSVGLVRDNHRANRVSGSCLVHAMRLRQRNR